jgi:hyperosmotically inducible periplasmic protein
MRFLLVLLFGILVGGAAVWFYKSDEATKSRLQTVGQEIEQRAKAAGDTIQDKLSEFHLTPDEIKNELARTGGVIRREAGDLGHKMADAADDTRITAAIKTKLVADSKLSALSISVNTTRGVVTLSGTVSSPDQISKAMLLAMETDGVRQVVSTLQIKH